ncbi:uncharacterized protein LOC123295806 [Chrysoperla carnea]|uniref:uncharacterized protein LOC123295806 n=1 Tax=Chrysoperla carnea TaxID=189513 RepID=UPI001D08B8FE|nr:uncharacterized protein LOC123295806 [Chrysoperla carnea]
MVNDSNLEKKKLAAELVCNAIADINEKNGDSTLHSIRRYIGKEYKLSPQIIENLIVPSVHKGVEFGVIKNLMGRYQLSGLMDNRRHQDNADGNKDDANDNKDDANGKCCPKPCPPPCGCCPKRKCNRSSKNFRRIDYKSAEVCYQDKNNPCGSPKACGGCG